MTELLTAAQMRAIEQAAIATGEVTGLELMERAGQGVVEAILEEWPELAGDRAEDARATDAAEGGLAPQPAATPESISGPLKAVVLCGPGNNGGDGFVVARLLAARGWAVEVFLYGDPEKLPPDARVNYERWCESGVVKPLTQSGLRQGDFATLYIDALFGTGLTRAAEGELFKILRHLSGVDGDRYNDRLVAIDAPSGLCLDSGRVLQQEPFATMPDEVMAHMPQELQAKLRESGGARPLNDRFAALTVCFDSPKAGHFLGAGPDLCGKVVVKDIGLQRQRCCYNGAPYDDAFSFGPKAPAGVQRPAFLKAPVGVQRPAFLRLVEPLGRVDDTRSWGAWPFTLLRKYANAHKFSHGHALILTGGSGKTGAARLSARGALRIGAGLVTLGVPPSAQMEVAAQITALMLTRVPDAAGLAEVLEDARINALCLGPGLGLERARDLVPVALASGRPTVLDADALSAYAEDPQVLCEMLHEQCVLTPHGGEFSRLFPDIAAKLAAPATQGPAYSKVDATRDAAKRAGCTVLFKGADTVIADPSGQCSVNAAVYSRSAPWLATAGSGDVLAGFITGLLARGFTPHQAAATAAYLHVEAALEFGPGLIAEDLPEILPKVLRKLMAG